MKFIVTLKSFDEIQEEVHVKRKDAPDIPSLYRLLKRQKFLPVLSSFQTLNDKNEIIAEKQNLSDFNNITVQQIPSSIPININLTDILQEAKNIIGADISDQNVKLEMSSENLPFFTLGNIYFIDLLDSFYIEYKESKYYFADKYYSILHDISIEDGKQERFLHSYINPYIVTINYFTETSTACFINPKQSYDEIIEKIEFIFAEDNIETNETIYLVKKDTSIVSFNKNDICDLSTITSINLNVELNSIHGGGASQDGANTPEAQLDNSEEESAEEEDILDDVDFSKPPPAASKIFPPESITNQVIEICAFKNETNVRLITEASVSRFLIYQSDNCLELAVSRMLESGVALSNGASVKEVKQELIDFFVFATKRDPNDRSIRGAVKVALKRSNIRDALTYLFSARTGFSSRPKKPDSRPGTLMMMLRNQKEIEGANWHLMRESQINELIKLYRLAPTPEERAQAIEEFCRGTTSEEETKIQTLMSMGDTRVNATARLQLFNGDINKAIDSLIKEKMHKESNH